tara:strand:- start:5 stop:199 length:195 start_codon:yes stop_codon:yes gene_type:complete
MFMVISLVRGPQTWANLGSNAAIIGVTNTVKWLNASRFLGLPNCYFRAVGAVQALFVSSIQISG